MAVLSLEMDFFANCAKKKLGPGPKLIVSVVADLYCVNHLAIGFVDSPER